jgi:hypothetical protein
MFKATKNRKVFALTLLTSIFLLAILSPNIMSVKAQGQATVTVLDSIGGTTIPAGPGTYTYADGTPVTFTATPNDLFDFQSWIVSSSAGSNRNTNNPLVFAVSGGVTYSVQATFSPILLAPYYNASIPPDTTTAAIVVILASAGGTTFPRPDTYALANATSMDLTATADSGWQFSHWVISGPNLSHGGYPYTATPTDNPYNVNHGYGNRYVYQPVFVPTGAGPTPTPTPTGGATATPTGTIGGLTMDSAIIIGLVVVIIVILIAFGVYASRRRK